MPYFSGYHDTTDGSNLSNGKREKPQVDFDDAFVQELMDKIEILTKEKSDISHELLQEKSLKEESNRKVAAFDAWKIANYQESMIYLKKSFDPYS